MKSNSALKFKMVPVKPLLTSSNLLWKTQQESSSSSFPLPTPPPFKTWGLRLTGFQSSLSYSST